MGESYVIGVRTKMASHTIRESDISWIDSITTPQCLSWHDNDTDLCAPYPPKGLKVHEIEVDHVVTSLNVSWNATLPQPHYYILELLSLSSLHSPPSRFNVSGNRSCHIIESVSSNITLYQVHLTAVNPGGSITVVSPQLHLEKKAIVHGKVPLLVKIIVMFLVACSLIAVTVMFFIKKPHINQVKKYCDPEGLLVYEPAKDPKNFIEFSYPFDDLEISLDNIKIEEELGSGAFGIVKRCIFKDKDCIFKDAAVKMLKCE